MKRMHDSKELHDIAAEEAGKLDRVIPTGIGVKSTGALYLEHDGEELEEQVPVEFKQLFGKHTITGSGNIDLYHHSITITLTSAGGSWKGSIITSNGNPIDSPTDLFAALEGKMIPGCGTVDGSSITLGVLCVKDGVTSTGFYPGGKISGVGNFKVEDVVTTI